MLAFDSLRWRLKPEAQTRSRRRRLLSLTPFVSKSKTIPSHNPDFCNLPSDDPSLTGGMPIAKNGKLVAVRLVPKKFPGLDSPHADRASICSDAAGEPLVNDTTSDFIPKSVRPLMIKRGSVDDTSDAGSDFASKLSDTTYDIDLDEANSVQFNSAPTSPRSVIYRADSFQDAPRYV
jgi:hypothetical protein